MKTPILLTATLLLLASCKKEAQEDTRPVVAFKITKNIMLPETDTMPDGAMLKIKLCKDSINSDETLMTFDRSANINFSNGGDALYFKGFGQVSLASISGDGRDLAINSMPYQPGRPIGLNVKARTDGAYFLKISYENKMPSGIQVWLRDNDLKDSVDLRKGNYNFNITQADSNTFGKGRFRVILKASE